MGSVGRVVSSVVWLSVIGSPVALGQVGATAMPLVQPMAPSAPPPTALPLMAAPPQTTIAPPAVMPAAPPLTNFVPPQITPPPPQTTIAPPAVMPEPPPPLPEATEPAAALVGPEPTGTVGTPAGDVGPVGQSLIPGETVVTPVNPTPVTPEAGGGVPAAETALPVVTPPPTNPF